MNEYAKLCDDCAQRGRALMQQLANNGSPEPLYLFARHSAPGNPGRLCLVRESAPHPEGCHLVTGDGLRANVPYDHYFQWVADRARRAPILSMED